MGKPTPTDLDYYGGQDKVPLGHFKISPSSFNQFMTSPQYWYREKVLGEGGFEGNTASVIGTVVHYVAEMVAKGKVPNGDEISQYISNMSELEEVDGSIVLSSYKSMAEALINTYVLKNMPSHVEEFIITDLGSKVHIGGSVDAVFQDDCVVDYKTYNSKTKPKVIPMNYKYQLLVYAYIYKLLGRPMSRIRLVYVNRPIDGRYVSEKTGRACGKVHPPEVTVLTESITDEDMDFIESCITLCKETYLRAKQDPSLVHLLYRDMRLKIKE